MLMERQSWKILSGKVLAAPKFITFTPRLAVDLAANGKTLRLMHDHIVQANFSVDFLCLDDEGLVTCLPFHRPKDEFL